mgnify:CR=1 FL=1
MKRYILLLLSLMSAVLAADQTVYIKQIQGDNLDVTINQNNGDDNIVGWSQGADQYFLLEGDSQTFTIDQIGSRNGLAGFVTLTDMFMFNMQQVGDDNQLDFLANNASFSDVNMVFTGSDNSVLFDLGGPGSGQYANIDWTVTGDYNNFTSMINADGALQDITLTGDFNIFKIDQIGYGTSIDFHELYLDMTGDNNQVTIVQDTTLAAGHIDLVTNGSNQIINITQSD